MNQMLQDAPQVQEAPEVNDAPEAKQPAEAKAGAETIDRPRGLPGSSDVICGIGATARGVLPQPKRRSVHS